MAKGLAPMGFLEPLRQLVTHHGDQLQVKLSGMRESLAAIQSNTEAQVLRNQTQRRSVQVAGKLEGEESATRKLELRNDSAYGWLVKWVASDCDNEVTIHIGSNDGSGFMLHLNGGSGESLNRAREVCWYIPVNGVIFINTKTESELDHFVNFEVEVLETFAAQGFTGPSGEEIEVERREQLPPTAPFSPIA